MNSSVTSHYVTPRVEVVAVHKLRTFFATSDIGYAGVNIQIWARKMDFYIALLTSTKEMQSLFWLHKHPNILYVHFSKPNRDFYQKLLPSYDKTNILQLKVLPEFPIWQTLYWAMLMLNNKEQWTQL